MIIYEHLCGKFWISGFPKPNITDTCIISRSGMNTVRTVLSVISEGGERRRNGASDTRCNEGRIYKFAKCENS